MNAAEPQSVAAALEYTVREVQPVKLAQALHVRQPEYYRQFKEALSMSLWCRPGCPPLPEDVADGDIELMRLSLFDRDSDAEACVWLDAWWPYVLALTQNASAGELASDGQTMFADKALTHFRLWLKPRDGSPITVDGGVDQAIALMVLMAPAETVLRIADHLTEGLAAAGRGEAFDEYVPHLIAECYGECRNSFGYFTGVDMLKKFIAGHLGLDPFNRFVVQVSRGDSPVIVEIDADNVEEGIERIVGILS